MKQTNAEMAAVLGAELALVQRRRKALQTANVALQQTSSVRAAREALGTLTASTEVAGDAIAIIDALAESVTTTHDAGKDPAAIGLDDLRPYGLTGPEAKMAFAAAAADSLNTLAERHGNRLRCTAAQVHAVLADYIGEDPAGRNALFEQAMEQLLVTRGVPPAAGQDVSAG